MTDAKIFLKNLEEFSDPNEQTINIQVVKNAFYRELNCTLTENEIKDIFGTDIETEDFTAKIDLDGFKAVYSQRDLFDKFEISNELNEAEKNEESKCTKKFRELLNLTKIKQIYEAITDLNGNIIIEALKNYFINKLNFTVTDDQIEMISNNGT